MRGFEVNSGINFLFLNESISQQYDSLVETVLMRGHNIYLIEENGTYL